MICLACQKEYTSEPVEIQDHFLTQEVFGVSFCPYCQLGNTILPRDLELARYYASNDYVSHAASGKNLLQAIYLLARKFTLKGKTRLIGRFTRNNGCILDYGCGTGAFLAHLKSQGYSVAGIEPDSGARRIATQVTGNQIYAELQDLTDNTRYDLITLWHVLEHTPDPVEILIRLKETLNASGKILVAVPNHKSRDCMAYGPAWAGYDVPRHLWHFSKSSILKISERTGLKLLETIPMKLDAYYVSLLSEKYKGSTATIQWIRAFISGLHSNLYARKTGEWSSLIYIFEA